MLVSHAYRYALDGTFNLGTSIVRFDAFAGSQPQRISIDDARLYRVELP